MNFFNKIKPELALRLSFGAMYIYSGWDIFQNPSGWTWAIQRLPEFMSKAIMSIPAIPGFAASGDLVFLRIQGLGELVFAAIFLLWFLPARLVKWVALLSAVEMALILWLVGVSGDTFRDIGLLGASLAVFLIYNRKQYGF